MGKSLWEVFASVFRRTPEEETEADDGGFVPSPMDLSVRISHGGPDQDIDRELTRLEEEAEVLLDYEEYQ